MRSRFLCTADPPFPLSLQPLLLEAWLFQISRVSGIMQHLSSSDWSISLTMMSCRFIHIVAYGRIFFLRLNNILLYIYKYAYMSMWIYMYTHTTFSLSICPSMDIWVFLLLIQFSSVAQLCLTLCDPMNRAAHQASLSITSSWSPPKLMSIELVMPSNHLILCVIPLSSCLQSFPTSGSFQMSQLFASGGQNIGVSASTSVLPMNTQDWHPLDWLDE